MDDSDERNPFMKDKKSLAKGNRFVEGDSSGEESEPSQYIGPGSQKKRPGPGADDVRPNMDPRVSVEPKPISGPLTTPEDLKAIFEGRRKKKDKKKNRPPGADYDDIRPGGGDNEPDPDHMPGDGRMNDY